MLKLRPEQGISSVVNGETAEAWALGAVGAVQGGYRYYVKPELTAKRAWATILAGVTIYELACPKSETLSEGVDRLLDKSKLWAIPIGYTTLHLLNVLPPQIDLFHQVTKALNERRV